MSIVKYAEIKRDMDYARAWLALIGSSYRGGGGGIGKLVQLTVQATVYHQHSDGAKNYHEAPEALRVALGVEVAKRFPEIATAAVAAMEESRLKAANAAHEEHAKLMREAGLLAGETP